MDANKKKRIVITVSIAALLGVGGYFAFKFIKKMKAKKAEEEAAKLAASTTTTTSPAPSGTSAPKPKPTIISNPFKSKAELTAFQNWVLTMYPFDRGILGKTGADGDWGQNSANAWTKYGTAYNNRNTASIISNWGSGSLFK
jgi:hypothetical protein